MASVRPFQFKGLPSYTAQQVAVHESLRAFLSSRPFNPHHQKVLTKSVGKYLKEPVDLGQTELRTLAGDEVTTMVPDLGCFVVLGAAPGPHKILVDIDPAMAFFAVERLLGGPGDGAHARRPLTETEQGVLSFLLLKTLSHLHEGLINGQELALCLDRVLTSLGDAKGLINPATTYFMLGMRFSVGARVGYLRAFLPSALVTERFGAPVAQSGGTNQDLAHMRRILGALGPQRLTGRLEVATLDLGPDDIAGLEVGDIIILENHHLALSPEGITGEVYVRFGRGENGFVRGSLLAGSEQAKLHVLEIVQQEDPSRAAAVGAPAMTDEEMEAEPADNLPETEGLLRDAPAPVVVELGRIQMNMAQVIRLRAGQVIRLPRAPTDPVDVVVNGKLFAKAELIEVDGELGVRLLQVTGA